MMKVNKMGDGTIKKKKRKPKIMNEIEKEFAVVMA